MNKQKKSKCIRSSAMFLAACLLFLTGGEVSAANSRVAFDAVLGTLSISGSCSAGFVLVVIRRASDGSIWGSSNPDCVKGSYSYEIAVPANDRTGGTFIVDAVDGGRTPAAAAAMAASTSAVGTVTFSEPAPDISINSAIIVDTSSIAAVPDDGSFLDGVLQQFFGIVTSIVNTVKASVVAAIQIFAKTFTVLPGGSIVVPKGADQVAGEGWLNPGTTDVFIPDALVASSSEIIVTLTSPSDVPLAVTQKIDGNGFHVGAIRAQSMPISFAWLVVNTYAVGAPTVAEQSVSFAPAVLDTPSISASASSSPLTTAIATGTATATMTTTTTTTMTTTTTFGIATTTNETSSTVPDTSTSTTTDVSSTDIISATSTASGTTP